MESFLSKFAFKPELRGAVGVEREYFLLDRRGDPVPTAMKFLERVADPAWIYELSACQVEHRTSPQFEERALRLALRDDQVQGKLVADELGLRLAAVEVGPENMPLDVYPDERYLRIVESLPRQTLLAACRVTGTHLHFGAHGLDEAIAWHNALREHLPALCAMGDHSDGERLRIYKVMAPSWLPPRYDSKEHFFETAREQGFEGNPRNCWHLIRISRHGTVELRMFGMTEEIEEILWYVRTVRNLLR